MTSRLKAPWSMAGNVLVQQAIVGGLDTVSYSRVDAGPVPVSFSAVNEDGSVTVPSLTNGLLTVTMYAFGATTAVPHLDPAGANIALTQVPGALVNFTLGGQPMAMDLFYLQNPPAGTWTMRYTTTGLATGISECWQHVRQSGLPFGTPVIHTNNAGLTDTLVTGDAITANAQNQVHIYAAAVFDGSTDTCDQTMVLNLGDFTGGFTSCGAAVARGAGSVGMIPQFHMGLSGRDYPWMIGAVKILPS